MLQFGLLSDKFLEPGLLSIYFVGNYVVQRYLSLAPNALARRQCVQTFHILIDLIVSHFLEQTQHMVQSLLIEALDILELLVASDFDKLSQTLVVFCVYFLQHYFLPFQYFSKLFFLARIKSFARVK